jgi:TRAP-type C4-dicarboxylate transport system permease small subunit
VVRTVDRLIGAITAAGSVLVLPVSLLLFLQWPLREWVQAYSREANDLAQSLFALYVALAITCATRRHTHLASDALAQRYPSGVRRTLVRVGSLAVVAPWALFVLHASWPIVAQSVRQLESFPETYNPGYFVIKVALFLLALLALLQAVLEPFRDSDAQAR